MQPVGRTVSYDRGWNVNDLEESKREGQNGLRVEIAQAPHFFPDARDFHRSWSKYAGLVGGDNFVLNATPGDAAAEERGKEIEQVQKWNEQCDHDINPRLRHDFRACTGYCFRDADHPECTTEGCKK